MTVTYTHDGTVIIFDSEVGTVSANSVEAARRKINRHKVDKRAREYFKALAQSRPFR